MGRLGPVILALFFGACAEPGPKPSLDTREILARFDWWDNRDWDWYEKHIPFFDSPDPELNATYYYRWELLTKHMVYGSPESGYTFTEFIDRPFWSGTYGAISCPLGHQFYEIRWLKDRRIIEDFSRYWFETPGAEPRSYSNWYGDAMWATYQVLGDKKLLRKVYPHMEAQVEGWTQERWDGAHGMYRWVGAWDGMETNINSRLTDDPFGGAEGYRPTLNTYMFADLLALSRTAGLFGEDEKAREFADRASFLKARVQEELWDPDREFFFHQFASDEKGGIEAKTLTYGSGTYEGNPHGRELLGYVPWQFNLPDPGYEAAWQFLFDPDYFWAPFGPTGVEQGDPQFWVSPRCCVWSGNAWPYATTQTLSALANLLNNYQQDVVDVEDFSRLLLTYARSHRFVAEAPGSQSPQVEYPNFQSRAPGAEERPYLAEASDPFTGSWAGHNTFYHSEHYLHSGFVDLVVTGLVGLRPQATDTLVVNPLIPAHWDYFALAGVDYHGHDLSIIWDREGKKYGKGVGLSVFLNGTELGRTLDLRRLSLPVPPPVVSDPDPRLNNYAVNNSGHHFPLARASSSHPTAPPFYAVDGNRWYHPSPPNRWVAAPAGESAPNEDSQDFASPRTAATGIGAGEPDSQWFEVDFGAERPITSVKLYFLDDENGPSAEAIGEEASSGFPASHLRRPPPALPPDSFDLLAWNGGNRSWEPIPGQERTPEIPRGRQSNTVTFSEVATERIRVLLHPRSGATVGLTEFEAWGPGALPLPAPTGAVENLAWNQDGQDYPKISASYSFGDDSPDQAVDGRFALTRYSRNRWTAYQSPNAEDWLEVNFGAPVPVGRVEIFLYGDGEGVAAPQDFRLEKWTSAGWEEIPSGNRTPQTPTAWAVNTLTFPRVSAERIRVNFRHALPAFTGVTELRIWPK